MHGQNVKFPIAFAQPRTQARERNYTSEEHLKRQIQDPRNIEHIFQVCIVGLLILTCYSLHAG